jgi:hypothetical protein
MRNYKLSYKYWLGYAVGTFESYALSVRCFFLDK